MPELIGLDWDERLAWEVQNKGWYEQAELQMDDGRMVSLSLWDPVRFSQELEAHFALGEAFFAERNLIILPVLTEAAIRNALAKLISRGHFDV